MSRHMNISMDNSSDPNWGQAPQTLEHWLDCPGILHSTRSIGNFRYHWSTSCIYTLNFCGQIGRTGMTYSVTAWCVYAINNKNNSSSSSSSRSEVWSTGEQRVQGRTWRWKWTAASLANSDTTPMMVVSLLPADGEWVGERARESGLEAVTRRPVTAKDTRVYTIDRTFSDATEVVNKMLE